ncbi:MAG: c-type cytochrome biogenesis protein CcmI [Gammaproteobacteria bacterium]|nr:c-type cytochrome biogenesis protein CcmI [Gammaproteobacteria bacterium]
MSFWIAAALMLAACVFLLLRPLLRTAAETEARDHLNLRVFRERLAELDGELADGRLDAGQHAALKRDLELAVLAEVPETGSAQAEAQRRPGVLMLLVFLVLPVASLGLYGKLGASRDAEHWQGLLSEPQDLSRIETAIEQAGQAQDADAMGEALLRLRALLRQEPGNGDAWYALGRAYVGINEAEAGVAALAQAYRQSPEDLAVIVGYAQTLILANEGKADAESDALLAKALSLNPKHEGALMLQGFSRFTAGRYAEAIAAWESLLAGRPEDSESRRLLQTSIDEARRRMSPQAAAGDIAVEIDITPELRTRIGTTGRIFVYAKAGDGSPMPLAALALSPGDWPVRVSLGDAQAMTPARKLSQFAAVSVGARWSPSGQATPQSGDIEAQSPVFDRASQQAPVKLVLSQIRP